MEPDAPALRRAIVSAPGAAGAVEVRLDAMAGPDRVNLARLFRGAPRPIIACCRRKQDGGLYTGSERRRREILKRAAGSGATYVDLEDDVAPELGPELSAASPSVRLIVSHHDTGGMPRDPERSYRRMARVSGAAAIKIVGTARGPADLLKARELLACHKGTSPPLISFCMGSAGVMSRILALEWGSWATYASAGEGKQAAPGQVSLSDLIGMHRIEDIDSHTHLTGIIGTPLGHTLSPAMHNACFSADGLNFRYIPIEVPRSAGLRNLGERFKELRIRGLSVTAPYKVRVMRQLDSVEPLAERIGAVNTIVWDGARLIGFNTDATGGLAAMAQALAKLGLSPRGLTVAVVGSGGAARALAHACAMAGASVLVAGRSRERTRLLARAAGARCVDLAHLGREKYDVLVNCTPVGMAGGAGKVAGASPVSSDAVKGTLVFDIVYLPEETPLLRAARRRGIATLGGLEMLVRQAAEQYELFTGREARVDLMREAARAALEGRRPGG